MTNTTAFPAVATLGDRELLDRTKGLAASERATTAELVAHLAEVEARRLHLGEGFGSLFSYCTVVLRLSEHAAFNRIEAARPARRFPEVLTRLVRGEINLTAIRILAPHLTDASHRQVLDEARGRSKQELAELVARLAPKPDVPTVVRRVPEPVRSAPQTPATDVLPWLQSAESPQGASAAGPASSLAQSVEPAPSPTCPPSSSTSVTPLAPARYRVQFTVDQETRDRLRRVQDLLRRQIPNGDAGALFDRALVLLEAELERKRHAATERPRARPGGRVPAPDSRYIPAAVRREVRRRDGGRCAFVSADGMRCRERSFLEYHHRHPHALGGPPTADNISLRCRAHNVYESELVFGARGRRSRRQASLPLLGS